MSGSGDSQIRDGGPSAAAGDGAIPRIASDGIDFVSPLLFVMVRHGVTEATTARRFAGSGVPGPHLSAAGRVQAARAADAVHRIGRKSWGDLPKVSRVIASPMNRAQNTGEALGRRSGIRVETDDRLREIDFGSWEGRTGAEIRESEADALSQWRVGAVAAPGGESFADVGARMDSLIVELAAEHAALCVHGEDVGRAYAFATHAVAIKSAVGISMGIDVSSWGSIWPSPASLTILQLRVTTSGMIAERHLMCLGAPVE
ncbi:histidine phosphatase family protein [Demequina aurantiaca]|uniref:histidine phosphatase family protein n=1 Tax=Demequina aurantiaca TaxID=676200 RepID=UPI000781C861|nr:histidine phosphatase family protein [Demequina aurantiaca]